MKHKLTSPVTPAQLLTPRYIHHTFTFLCMFLLSSVVHSRASLGAEPDLIHQQVVEEFKSRVLQHMGRTTPPRGYNASRHSLDGKLIRDFLRKRFSKSQQSDSIYLRDKYADSKQDNLQTFVFPSTGRNVNTVFFDIFIPFFVTIYLPVCLSACLPLTILLLILRQKVNSPFPCH